MLRIQIPKGGILRPVQIPLYLIGRFWSYVERPSLKACWPWIGGRNDYGYGVFELGEFGQIYAHRLAYAFKAGRLVLGERIRHSCDNPPCCNPWHLLAGTMADNVHDCIDRGRRGRTIPRKVAPRMASAIIDAARHGEPRREIAERFGLHVSNVYRTLARR